jgi:hypothetical protein
LSYSTNCPIEQSSFLPPGGGLFLYFEKQSTYFLFY